MRKKYCVLNLNHHPRTWFKSRNDAIAYAKLVIGQGDTGALPALVVAKIQAKVEKTNSPIVTTLIDCHKW